MPPSVAGSPPGLDAVHDGGNEGERGGKKDGNLASCADLKDQRADARREQGDVGVHPGQNGNEDQRAEGHEQHLGADQAVLETKRVCQAVGLRHKKLRRKVKVRKMLIWFRISCLRHRRDPE